MFLKDFQKVWTPNKVWFIAKYGQKFPFFEFSFFSVEVKCSDYLKKLPWTFPQIWEINQSSPELDIYNIIFEPKILANKEKMQLFANLEILANFEPKKVITKMSNFCYFMIIFKCTEVLTFIWAIICTEIQKFIFWPYLPILKISGA